LICIRCNRDSKYSERSDGNCPGCGKQFAFEPKRGDKFTDKAFQSAIDRVSSGGKIRWGVEHLHYELARRIRRRPTLVALAWGTVLAIALGVGTGKWLVLLAAMVLVLAFAGWVRMRTQEGMEVALERSVFDLQWTRWCSVHGTPPSVITRAKEAPKPRSLAPDVGDYSFDRAVICDRARTVDLLLANNFHFENNCAVLAMNGYPAHAFDTVRKMLLRNPRLEVYALHDVSVTGCRMAHKLANDADWFKGRAKVIDVGLRPKQALFFRTLCLPALGPVPPGPGLTEREADWLGRFSLELAVMLPEQILKALFRAMTRTDDSDASGGGGGDSGGYTYDDSLTEGADTVDGGADSFG
jgi:hypothetical protein